jgi:hypothetical protein
VWEYKVRSQKTFYTKTSDFYWFSFELNVLVLFNVTKLSSITTYQLLVPN